MNATRAGIEYGYDNNSNVVQEMVDKNCREERAKIIQGYLRGNNMCISATYRKLARLTMQHHDDPIAQLNDINKRLRKNNTNYKFAEAEVKMLIARTEIAQFKSMQEKFKIMENQLAQLLPYADKIKGLIAQERSKE